MFTKIHHVAIAVADLAAATAWFERHFDIEPVKTMSKRHREEKQVDGALYEIGDDVIEVVTPISEESAVYDFLREHGDGIYHVAFEVDDIERSMELLQRWGVELEDDEPRDAFTGTVVTLDADSTVVPMQIVQREA